MMPLAVTTLFVAVAKGNDKKQNVLDVTLSWGIKR